MSFYSAVFKHLLFPIYEQVLRRRNTLRYLRQLEDQQWLSPEEIRELQWQKLLCLLRQAEARVPFYRDRMRKAGLTVRTIESPDDFQRLPVLTKDDIRQNHDALVAEGILRKSLHPSATGGSTGEPVQFGYDHDAYEWHMAGAARADRWAGWDWGLKQFHISGVTLQPERWLSRLKKRAHERFLRLKRVSAFDFTDHLLRKHVREYNRYQPVIVVGYANALYEFARFCKDRDLDLWKPKGVISSAERLYPHQRRLCENVFGAPVFDRYGSREMMNIAAECDRHQGLHINADNVYLELEKEGLPAEMGEVGQVLVTDLNNYEMPFIRYRIGDMAVAGSGPCGCGRGLPLLERVVGRVLDVIVTPDGRSVAGEYFPHLLKDYAGISRFQVYQDRSFAVTVRIVPAQGLTASTLEEIRSIIARQLGPAVPLSLALVDDIPLTRGGKYRVTISDAWADRHAALAVADSERGE